MIAYSSRRSVCGKGTAKRSSILSLVLGKIAVTMPDPKEAPSTRTLVPTFMLWPCRYEKIATTKRLSQLRSDASDSYPLTCVRGVAPTFRPLPPGGSPVGSSRGVQSLLLFSNKSHIIFQSMGELFFLRCHSLLGRRDVPPRM